MRLELTPIELMRSPALRASLPAKRPPGHGAGYLAVFVFQLTVYENIMNALRKFGGLFVSRVVHDRRRIKMVMSAYMPVRSKPRSFKCSRCAGMEVILRMASSSGINFWSRT